MRHKHTYKQISDDRAVWLMFFFPPSQYYLFECVVCDHFELVYKAKLRSLVTGS